MRRFTLEGAAPATPSSRGGSPPERLRRRRRGGDRERPPRTRSPPPRIVRDFVPALRCPRLRRWTRPPARLPRRPAAPACPAGPCASVLVTCASDRPPPQGSPTPRHPP